MSQLISLYDFVLLLGVLILTILFVLIIPFFYRKLNFWIFYTDHSDSLWTIVAITFLLGIFLFPVFFIYLSQERFLLRVGLSDARSSCTSIIFCEHIDFNVAELDSLSVNTNSLKREGSCLLEVSPLSRIDIRFFDWVYYQSLRLGSRFGVFPLIIEGGSNSGDFFSLWGEADTGHVGKGDITLKIDRGEGSRRMLEGRLLEDQDGESALSVESDGGDSSSLSDGPPDPDEFAEIVESYHTDPKGLAIGLDYSFSRRFVEGFYGGRETLSSDVFGPGVVSDRWFNSKYRRGVAGPRREFHRGNYCPFYGENVASLKTYFLKYSQEGGNVSPEVYVITIDMKLIFRAGCEAPLLEPGSYLTRSGMFHGPLTDPYRVLKSVGKWSHGNVQISVQRADYVDPDFLRTTKRLR